MSFSPGSVIAERYRILGVLGRGGVGTTYLAEHLATHTHVALKHVELAGLSDWKAYELFEREARVLSALSHPAIPTYREHFTIGEGGATTAFVLVQELAPGKTLATWVAEGWRPTEAEVRALAVQVLVVLRDLHARRPPIIHRDIKPENLVRDHDGTVRLVDFGAVRDTYRTLAGGTTMVGTYGYMAPEQLHGEARPESDLYGLGATVLFLLSGRSPAELPRERLRIAFRGRVHASRDLAAWLDRMIAPAPEERFASAHLAYAALRDGVPKPGTTSRTKWLLGALAGITAVTAATITLVAVRDAKHEKTAAAARLAAFVPRMPARPPAGGTSPIKFERGIIVANQSVAGVAFTPDGSELVTASFDGTLKLWDVEKGKIVRVFAGHSGRVCAVAITPDGKSIVSGGDTTVRIWDRASGALVTTIAADARRVTSVAIAPDASFVASGGFDGTAKVWELPSGHLLGTLSTTPPSGTVLSVAISPDGKNIATGGEDARVRIWNAGTRTLSRALEGHASTIDAVAWAPDGQALASSSDDHTVRLWHAATGRAVGTLRDHDDEVWAVAFLPSGSSFVSADKRGDVAVHEAVMGRVLTHYATNRPGIASIAFSSKGTMATGGFDGVLQLWRVGPPPPIAVPRTQLTPDAPAPPIVGSAAQVATEEARRAIDAYAGDGRALDEAEKKLHAVLDGDPRFASAIAELGRAAYKRAMRHRNDYAPDGLLTALKLAEKALAISPRLVTALALQGWVYEQQGDTARAAKASSDALVADPTSVYAKLLAGDVAMKAQDLDEAEKMGRDVVEHSRERGLVIRGYELLYDVYRARENGDAIDAVYKYEIALSPDGAWLKGNYAGFLVGRGECDGAVVQARAALALMDYGVGHETLADALVCKGDALLWDRGDPVPARAAYEQALAAHAGQASAWYGIGASHAFAALHDKDMRELAAAREGYGRALALDPQHALARTELALLPPK
jgi:tetratricopeptide (TPR) repeat protein